MSPPINAANVSAESRNRQPPLVVSQHVPRVQRELRRHRHRPPPICMVRSYCLRMRNTATAVAMTATTPSVTSSETKRWPGELPRPLLPVPDLCHLALGVGKRVWIVRYRASPPRPASTALTIRPPRRAVKLPAHERASVRTDRAHAKRGRVRGHCPHPTVRPQGPRVRARRSLSPPPPCLCRRLPSPPKWQMTHPACVSGS